MAYTIDSTLQLFPFLLSGDKTNLDIKDIDFKNTSDVISKLQSLKHTLFKNIHQRLIDHLISFFQFQQKKGGAYSLKIYSFHAVWENMVLELLRTRFSQINENDEWEWSDERLDNHFHKRTIHPDIRGKLGHSIEPDYYLVKNDKRYIFDAKYYYKLTELDYKQIAYYFLLKHYGIKNDELKNVQTYNALILPTEKEDYRQIHFQLNPEYNLDEEQFIVNAYYLNMLMVMENYV